MTRLLHPVESAPPRAGRAALHARSPSDDRIESETRRVGRALFRRIADAERGVMGVSRGRLEKALMGALMRDEELRYRALRFVDVYPALNSSGAIARHLQQYLVHRSLSFGGRPTRLMQSARRGAALGRYLALSVAWSSRLAISAMARQFIAGENAMAVAPKLRALERDGFAFSLDLLGEFVASEAQADEFARRYLEMIEHVGRRLGRGKAVRAARISGPRVNVSIKLSSLASKFDPMDAAGTTKTVLERLRPLFRAARENHAFINIDMEKYEYRDLTWEILRELLSEDEFREFEDVGTVVQSYLVDAPQFLDEILGWLRRQRRSMTLRLVKGAYWDSEQIWAQQRGWPVPVLTDKRATDAQYERLTRTLLENHRYVRTALASHNVRSLAHGIALRRALEIPVDRVEIQMLYGMAGPIAGALRTMELPVRVYVPCGELIPGMAYLVRRILENTANDSFLKQRFGDHVGENVLLRDPKSVQAEDRP